MTKDEMRVAAEKAAEYFNPPLMREPKYWPDAPYVEIFKAGAVPYRLTDDDKLEYFLFEPAAMLKDENPGFQICKGTREIFDPTGGEWENYHNRKQLEAFGAENLEDLRVTAIREAIEEVGLKAEHMLAAGEWGQAAFTSASTGALKTMWLYAIQLEADAVFDEPHETEANTIAREWFSLESESQCEKIRPDHLNILKQIDKVLQVALNEG